MEKALANPESTLAKVNALKAEAAKAPADGDKAKGAQEIDEDPAIEAGLQKLPPEDRQLAEAQRFCPILTENRLGVMGKPFKVMVDGEPVFLCCEGCKDKALAKSAETIAKVRQLRGALKSVTK
jgi:hypothetical protein